MNKTENVSIGRRPYVCDKDAYALLMAYLERSKLALKKDPDVDEVLQDLEYSIANHLDELSPGLVVDLATAEAVIATMGEVNPGQQGEYDEKSGEDTVPKSDWERIKRVLKKPMLKDHSRQVVDGVCAGIARSLDIDPFWIRALFVVLTILTDGFWILIYIVLSVTMKEENPRTKGRKASEVMSSVRTKMDDTKVLVRIERVLRSIVVVSYKAVKVGLQVLVAGLLLALIAAWLTAIFRLSSDSDFVPLLTRERGWLEYIFVGGLGLMLIIPLAQLLISPRKQLFRNIAWSIWVLATMATVASGINLYPKVRDYILAEKPSNQFISATVINGRIEDFCLGYCKPESVVRVAPRDCRTYASGLEPNSRGIADSELKTSVSYIREIDREIVQTEWYGWAYTSKKFDTPLSIDTYCAFIESVQKSTGNNVIFVETLPTNGLEIVDAINEQKSGNYELMYYVRDPDPVKWYES